MFLGVIDFLKRLYYTNEPPVVPPKRIDALRFGILGAARIGPKALITPSKSHPDVVISAVASRDATRAADYAKQYHIGKTYTGQDCYQKLIDDPEIDAIYNPLPNGLHYEWTMKALAKGKHVLVEKPIADTEAEAARMVALAQEKDLVLLEAIHHTFHPAIQRVRKIIDSGELGSVKSIKSVFAIPQIPEALSPWSKDDIRFNYDLGGGAMMDLGVYPLSAISYLVSREPSQVRSAVAYGHPVDPARVDRGMRATLSFPPSIEGEIYADFAMPGRGPMRLMPQMYKCDVNVELEKGSLHFTGFLAPQMYHRIYVRPTGQKPRTETAYVFKDGPGEYWWTTYRYQLEAFVDKVRRRTPQTWPDPEEPTKQMRWIEQIYASAGMPPRPASTFVPDNS